MAEPAESLFPDAPEDADPRAATGVVPSQGLRQLIRKKAIWAESEIAEDQIQPASLDLRLGATAWRIRASFLPGPGSSVQDKIAGFAMHEIDLRGGAVLEKGCAYIVRLKESLHLTRDIAGHANPKSSVGRLDVFTRVITDRASEFDTIAAGYKGPLYAEIAPLAFSVIVREGSRLGQLRLKRGSPALSLAALRELYRQVHPEAVEDRDSADAWSGDDVADTYRGGFPISVDLAGRGRAEQAKSKNHRAEQAKSKSGGDQPIGWKAKNHAPLIDVDVKGKYDPMDFWEPVFSTGESGIILDPNDFYILASREAISVPPDYAAEMVAYDTMVGEFRVHYAGFFDPGFGYGEAGGASLREGDAPASAGQAGTGGTGGTRAVLEVRSHEVPFMVEHGQTVGRLIYEKLAAIPDKLYGQDIGSSYQRQGLKLGKQFKAVG